MNLSYNMGLFKVKVYNYEVNVYSDGEISDIFEKKYIKNGNYDCIIKGEYLDDKQIQRLLINREVMLKYKDNWVMHSVSCKLKTGDNLVICGDTGSGKSYFYGLLIENGLVEKLYDEDLIGIDSEGVLFSLAKANFKGKLNGGYNYEYDEPNFGKADLFVIMGDDISESYNRNLFINSIVHNIYKADDELLEHYNQFPKFSDIRSFYIPSIENKNRQDFIYSVIEDIGIKKKKSY